LSAAALAPDRRAKIQSAWDNRRRARIASAWDNRKPHCLDTGIYAPLPKRGTKAGEEIAWAFPEELTKQDAGHMARAMVALGLTRRLMTAPRCGTPLWYEARLPQVNVLRDDKLEWPVLLMASAMDAPERHAVWICTVSGDWITGSHGARGRSFASLGQYIWAVSEFEAARRLCRANGYRGVPRVGDLR
jgi:hypothetical protein